MRIAFCGTPDFAVPSLQMLIDEGHELALFTNPDKPKGRKGELTPPYTSLKRYAAPRELKRSGHLRRILW